MLDPSRGGHGDLKFLSDAHLFNVAGHAAVCCGSAVASGGKCGPGALSGAVGAFAGPMLADIGIQSNIVTNSVLGGLASVAGGGKFANGAVTGAFGYLFNELGSYAERGYEPTAYSDSDGTICNASYGRGCFAEGASNSFILEKTAALVYTPFRLIGSLIDVLGRPTLWTPDFVVSTDGVAFPVPGGAIGPTPTRNKQGVEWQGGEGGHGLNSRVTGFRIMEPNSQNPGGYGSYNNGAGQTVNPQTGRTIPRSDPWWHIPAR